MRRSSVLGLEPKVLKLTELEKGQKAIISRIQDGSVKEKLMEMGCVPGQVIELKFTAPFGDPIAFEVSGYCLSMRKTEADIVEIIKM